MLSVSQLCYGMFVMTQLTSQLKSLCATTMVNTVTFPHESSLVVVKQGVWHLLVAGLRDLLHVVECAVFHHIGQLLITQFFIQEQGDPFHC